MTVDKVYTFDGWYNGETKWNFDADTVKGDVNITITYAKKPAAAKKGCGGSVGGLGVMLTALGFAAVVFKKKRG